MKGQFTNPSTGQDMGNLIQVQSLAMPASMTGGMQMMQGNNMGLNAVLIDNRFQSN